MTPSPNCIALVKHFEGCGQHIARGMLRAYPDPGTGGAPWTIGYGSTGPDIHPETEWTQSEAETRFAHDLDAFAAKVQSALAGAPATQGQFDAMVDFAYNLGIGNLISSTLLRLHKAGDYVGAGREFSKWNKAAGRVLLGLSKRRAVEAALYAGATDLNHVLQQIEGSAA